MRQSETTASRVGALDGLRGLASIWVLLGHAAILTGLKLPVLSQPALGVDLFMMLSGFLMVYHHRRRAARLGPGAAGEWRTFWIRRFFRIAPLYYVLLAIALLLGPVLFGSRLAVDRFLSVPPQEAVRYLDSGPVNVLLHVSFLFGLLPGYAFRTPLPDWSLGLEMQFYALFPFLMLLIAPLGWLRGIAALGALAAAIGIGVALAHADFPQPSFLPLKFHMFACGMLLAGALDNVSRAPLHLGLAMLLALLPLGGDYGLRPAAVRGGLVVLFFALVLHDELPHLLRHPFSSLASLLGSLPFHWLGELSYGAYLIHLIVMQPVAALVIAEFGPDIGTAERFLLVCTIVLPLTYLGALAGYRFVELPGQRLGHRVVGLLVPRNAPRTTPLAKQS